ncbi:transglycosylase domain-containing protein [bacterium]|nr:transglycosylase domain-containing protein [bacterium]
MEKPTVRKAKVVEVKGMTPRQLAQARKQFLDVLMSPIRLFNAIVYGVGFSVIGVLVIAGILAYSFVRSLPDFNKMSFEQVKAITEKRVQARIETKTPHKWVDIDDVSRDFLFSVVMSEDSTFFEHNGVNYDAMASSLAENIREKKAAYGASTISQQVIKNVFLDNEKTVTRKVKEVLITLEMEKHLKKNQILELYLNLAEFGPDIYGVRAAAWHYFKKKPDKINAAEGAFMALMLPSPKRNHYAIFENKNLTRAKRRRIQRILNDMLYQEYISEKQYRRYLTYDFFTQAAIPEHTNRGVAGGSYR